MRIESKKQLLELAFDHIATGEPCRQQLYVTGDCLREVEGVEGVEEVEEVEEASHHTSPPPCIKHRTHKHETFDFQCARRIGMDKGAC